MSISTSVLADLVQIMPQLRPQIYFKSSLTALSHAMEDQVLAGTDRPLVIATFQQERFYRQEAQRYRRIAQRSDQVYVMAAPETEFKNLSSDQEMVAFGPEDPLRQEWNLVVLGSHYSTGLACVERQNSAKNSPVPEQLAMDQARPFEGIWTSDRQVCIKIAELLLERILYYRPELKEKIEQALKVYGIIPPSGKSRKSSSSSAKKQQSLAQTNGKSDLSASQFSDAFAHRLVTYLQAGQHKLLRVYRSLAAQERKERLVNSITHAIRQSLNPQEIIKVATQELGEAMGACRCLIYRCKSTDEVVVISQEYLCCDSTDDLGSGVDSLIQQTWPLQSNPLFQAVVKHQDRVYLSDTSLSVEEAVNSPKNRHVLPELLKPEVQKTIKKLAVTRQIRGWLMVPILYQGKLLGMVELHQCLPESSSWKEDELSLVDAIATQLSAALIQAQTYANLEDLNQQLEALERTRSNLIAITGHELRTPLSTIQVCLESLSQEPDMPLEMRQVMLETALTDAERLRKLVQDFLTLSNLESGRVDWHPETLPLRECVDLAISGLRSRFADRVLPEIDTEVPDDLPLVKADGEWLVELLSKLLDNACKFTSPEGKVTIRAKRNGNQMLEVTVADTGRGIEPNRLEAVFDRFYQEEGSLRRTVGGTGLGLAIGKQIVTGWGGEIWANSPGKNQGSQFHFTVPFVEVESEVNN
ncbi:DICT sensory domain-containing protein [Capilliphycus salinus ALCB114379]|uniref:DICT sensory domain-containing protein n=1 Tax=Capilliphycus salinus TaxID=2768948 RepID=UPI0039A594DE